MREKIVVAVGLLLMVVGLGPAAAGEAVRGEPTLEGRCGPDDSLPEGPWDVYERRASSVPALDLCAAWIEPVWSSDDTSRLVALDITVEVAGDLEDRPASSFIQFSGRFERPEETCRFSVTRYDRPEGVWDPYNLELRLTCEHVEHVTFVSTFTEFEFDDIDPALADIDGSILRMTIPFEDSLPWTPTIRDGLLADGMIRAPSVSSGLHSHIPYRSPFPVVLDRLDGDAVPVGSAG